MTEPTDTSLDNCGCCEADPAPAPIYNRPGLSVLSYRVGTYATFLRRMVARLGTYILPDGDFQGIHPLTPLTTRDADDPAIALLDASAVVADVLTFYQERIANEGFLQTATERRSILELARAIGYELSPGVAASAYLAFTVEDAKGAPGVAEIPAGSKVQSVPPQGQVPQTFETSADIAARAEWNKLRPRLTYPQVVKFSIQQVCLQGTATNLKAGDRLLLLINKNGKPRLARVLGVEVQDQDEQKRTLVTLKGSVAPLFSPSALSQGSVSSGDPIPFDEASITQYVRKQRWTDAELNTFLTFNRWDPKELLTYLSNDRKNNPQTSGSVYALRTTVGFFGTNAPAYSSLPSGDGIKVDYGPGWDQTKGFKEWRIWKDHQAAQKGTTPYPYYRDADVFLERVVEGLVPDTGKTPYSWAVFQSPKSSGYYKIASIIEKSLAAFAMSGKSSGLKLKTWKGKFVDNNYKATHSAFRVRNTIAYLQSELLPLAEMPLTSDIDAGAAPLELDGLVLGLTIGQAVIVTGERADAPGITESEALVISDINHVAGFTQLTFKSKRQYAYKRDTVKINANVASATHGETVTEILGNGNAAQANQKFTLKKSPLTYTAAPTPTGSASTLKLRVNNLLWGETPSLYGLGPTDQDYTIRIGDDAAATVTTGDNLQGARLPTGFNNIVATYRWGIGLGGQVAAGSLTTLQSKPLGVREVTNPLAASGAGDPETLDNARRNAPLTVRTLERIVSREDYEDFASGFAGIGKAQAVSLRSQEHAVVHLTIAGADGKPINDAKFLKNFRAALDANRDPAQRVMVDAFDPLVFDLSANVAIDSRTVSADVFAAIRAALIDAFSFAKRGFGQAVSAAEVITVIQKVAGVTYVDLDLLYGVDPNQQPMPRFNEIVVAHSARIEDDKIKRAQLLLIDPLSILLLEITA